MGPPLRTEASAPSRAARGRWTGPLAARCLAAACALVPLAAPAAMYKWVDDKGVVHYSDQIPPDAVSKGNAQLNSQGVTVKKYDPAANAEQQKARADEAARQSAAARETEANSRRDRAVLDSYTSETDIDLAKSRAVRTIQLALDSAKGYSAQLTKRKAALLERKATFGGKPVPADIERELVAGDAELARQADLIALKEKQLVEVTARYDADKERWRMLKGEQAKAAANAPPPPPPPPSKPPVKK